MEYRYRWTGHHKVYLETDQQDIFTVFKKVIFMIESDKIQA